MRTNEDSRLGLIELLINDTLTPTPEVTAAYVQRQVQRGLGLVVEATAISALHPKELVQPATRSALMANLVELRETLLCAACALPSTAVEDALLKEPKADAGRYVGLRPDAITPLLPPPLLTTELLTAGYASHVGRVRAKQEDEVLLADPARADRARIEIESVETARRFIAGVFDGCGGLPAGEVASILAAVTVLAELQGAPVIDLDALRYALTRAGSALRAAEKLDASLRGMGCTGTIAVVTEGAPIRIAHVGDSRAYVLRGKCLRQITTDHNYAAVAIEGGMTPEDAASAGLASILTRSLRDQRLELDVTEVPRLNKGDALLLATDGLFGMIGDRVIEETLIAYRDPGGACRRLVALANEAGGEDNVSVVVVRA